MDELQEWIEDQTLKEYGGFEGSLSAFGSISYNKKTKCITIRGSESDEENWTHVKTEKFTITRFFTKTDLKRVTRVFIRVHYDEGSEVSLHVENGPWTKSLDKAETAILNYLSTFLQEYRYDYRYEMSKEFRPDQEIELEILGLKKRRKNGSLT